VPVNGATGTGGQRLEWQWHNVELPIFDGVWHDRVDWKVQKTFLIEGGSWRRKLGGSIDRVGG
jgi:hypothetical protein